MSIKYLHPIFLDRFLLCEFFNLVYELFRIAKIMYIDNLSDCSKKIGSHRNPETRIQSNEKPPTKT